MTDDDVWRSAHCGGMAGATPEPKQAIDKISTDEDSEEPTHKCQICGEKTALDDYQKHTPNWCDDCEKVTRHERLD